MTFWEIIASNAAISGILAIIIAVIGRFWKNPAALHLLWIVVLVKLFTPPVISVALPLATEPPAAVETTKSETTQPIAPGPDALAALSSDDSSLASHFDASATASNSVAEPTPIANLKDRSWPAPWMIVSLFWLLGSGSIAMHYARRIRRFARSLRPLESPPQHTTAMIAELSSQLGLRRPPQAAMTPHPTPPLVWSIGFRPRVILPGQLFSRLSEPAQASIIAHELVHIRRGDHVVRLLELAATTLFWWHPAVWWAVSQLHDLEEACCDSRAVELLKSSARTYASALVDALYFLANQPRLAVSLPTAVSTSGSLARRIQMLSRPLPSRLTITSSMTVAAIALLPLATVFSDESASKSDPERTKQSVTDAADSQATEQLADDSPTLQAIKSEFADSELVMASLAQFKKSAATGIKAMPYDMHPVIRASLESNLAQHFAYAQKCQVRDYGSAMLAMRMLELGENTVMLSYRPINALPNVRWLARARYADLLNYARKRIEQESDALNVKVLTNLTLAQMIDEPIANVLERVQTDPYSYGYGEMVSEEKYADLVAIIDDTIAEAVKFSAGLQLDEENSSQLSVASRIAREGSTRLSEAIAQSSNPALESAGAVAAQQGRTKGVESLSNAIWDEVRRSEHLEITAIVEKSRNEARAIAERQTKEFEERQRAAQ